VCLSIASEIVKSIVTASQVKSTAPHVDIIQGIKKQSQVVFSAQIYSLHVPVVTIDWTAITKSGTSACRNLITDHMSPGKHESHDQQTEAGSRSPTERPHKWNQTTLNVIRLEMASSPCRARRTPCGGASGCPCRPWQNPRWPKNSNQIM
jgi:hypothetical protein